MKRIFQSGCFCLFFVVLSVVSFADTLECGGCADCTDKISSASPGDVVLLTSNIASHGAGCVSFGSATSVVFDCGGHVITGADSGAGISLEGVTGSEVKNCVVRSFDEGLSVSSSGTNTFVGNTLRDNDVGLYVFQSDANSFEGNSIGSNSDYGIYVRSSKGANVFDGDEADGNGRHGLYVLDSEAGDYFVGCSFDDNGRSGIYVDSSAGCNEFRDNSMSSNGEYGFHVSNSDLNVLSGNSIGSNGDSGVFVYSVNEAHVSANTVNDNGGHGLYLYRPGSVTLTCNTVSSNEDSGIYMHSPSSGSTISGNTISDNADYGIYLNGGISTVLSENVVSSNGWKGIYSYICLGCVFSGNQVQSNEGYGFHGSFLIGDISSNCFCKNLRDVYVYFGPLGQSDRCGNILGSWHDSGYSKCSLPCGSCSTNLPSCDYGDAMCGGYVTTTTSTTSTTSTLATTTTSSTVIFSPPTTVMKSVTFQYNVIDDGTILRCSLWTTLKSSWNVQDTDYEIELDKDNYFTVNDISPGTYEWNVECFDDSGQSVYAFNGPREFTIKSPDWIIPGDSDVVLVTDFSRSMRYCLDGSKTGCSGTSDCPLGHSTDCTGLDGDNPIRYELVKKLSKDFIDRVLSRSGNNIALIAYGSKALPAGTAYTHSLSTDAESLKSQIDAYVAGDDPIGGSTCVCCAVRRAKLLLEAESEPSRQKYVILMTDGVANHKCRDDPSNTEGWNYPMCCSSSRGVSDFNQGCYDTYGSRYLLAYDFPANTYECRYASYTGWYKEACRDVFDNVGINQAISDACSAYSGSGMKIYTIGMFDVDFASGCVEAVDTISQIADCGTGLSFIGSSKQELEDIYSRF